MRLACSPRRRWVLQERRRRLWLDTRLAQERHTVHRFYTDLMALFATEQILYEMRVDLERGDHLQ